MVNTAELKRRSEKLAPIDDSVQLPAAIRAAAAKAGELHKQAYEPETPAQQAPNGQERQQEEVKAPAPAAPVETGAKEVPAPTPVEGENYEHKYNSLKGRFDKQDDTIQQLNREIAAMRRQLEASTAAPPAPVRTQENTFKKLTPEEREAYGEDFIDVSARAAREKLDPELAELRNEVATLKQTLGYVAETTHRTQAEVMNDTLDKELSNWRQINRSEKFLAWLNLRDPYSGVIRLNMMREAHSKGDAHRVLTFFRGFLTDEAASDPARRTEPEVTTQGKIPLETLAAPGRAKASAATTPPDEKETITRSQVKEFYRLVNTGHYRGNEAEKDALERRIFDAEREGRIV